MYELHIGMELDCTCTQLIIYHNCVCTRKSKWVNTIALRTRTLSGCDRGRSTTVFRTRGVVGRCTLTDPLDYYTRIQMARGDILGEQNNILCTVTQ
jgi:hypothetical protein